MSVMPSDFANTGNGCIACTSKLNFMQSDLTDTGIGCIACASKLNFMQSDLTDTGIGCMVCASKLNFMPSDFADAGNGWKICATHHRCQMALDCNLIVLILHSVSLPGPAGTSPTGIGPLLHIEFQSVGPEQKPAVFTLF